MSRPPAEKLSGEKRRALDALAKRPDEKIDFSDIPEIRELPSDRVIGKYYRPRKTAPDAPRLGVSGLQRSAPALPARPETK